MQLTSELSNSNIYFIELQVVLFLMLSNERTLLLADQFFVSSALFIFIYNNKRTLQ